MRFGNVGTALTTVIIKIGGVTRPTTYTLDPNESTGVRLPNIDNGPVEVLSDGQPLIASLRINLKTHPNFDSCTEIMGLSVGSSLGFPANQLSPPIGSPGIAMSPEVDALLYNLVICMIRKAPSAVPFR